MNSRTEKPTRKASALAILPLGLSMPSIGLPCSSVGGVAALGRIMMINATTKLAMMARKARAIIQVMPSIIGPQAADVALDTVK